MNKLKRCPFCNNGNISVVVDNAEYSLGLVGETDVHFKVICSTTSYGCGASSGWCNTEQEAVDAWNTRTPQNDEVRE